MYSEKFTAILVMSLLFSATVSNACHDCNGSRSPPPPPTVGQTPLTPPPPPIGLTPPPPPIGLTPPPPPGTPSSSQNGSCPRDALKLGVCADILGLIDVSIGAQPSSECCALIEGLLDLEAALCLCTAIKANVLGLIHLNLEINVSLILSACQKSVPPAFQCP